MNITERLTEIAGALEELKLPYLVMGGHAVRYYGVDRNTLDHDFHVRADLEQDLKAGLPQTSLFLGHPPKEIPTWRSHDFIRFSIGTFPDGKEELLEFWLRNHLLPDFRELYARREEGLYGGRLLPFLSLPDLIRSKETERESDWEDITLLEEILDHRNFSQAQSEEDLIHALSRLRSRRGFELTTKLGITRNINLVTSAFLIAENPISQAFLAPLASHASYSHQEQEWLHSLLKGPLQKVEPHSPRHLALVEVVRRRYKQQAIERDRGEKASHF